MLMTNLKMDPPKKGNVKKTYLGVKFSSKAASCKLEFKPVTSLVLIPKLLMGGGGKKKKKNHTSGSSCSTSSTLESLMHLKTSIQPLGSFFQLQAQRANAVCMCVYERGSESGHRWEVFIPHGEERVGGKTFLEGGRNYSHLQRQERIACLGWSKWFKSPGGYYMLGWGTGGYCGGNLWET